MKTLVIFDLDGTLLNTITDLGKASNYAIQKLGYSPHPMTAYNYMVGNGVRKLLQRAAPDSGPEEQEELLTYFRQYYDEHCLDSAKPYPGVPELLKGLQEKGIKIAVATNKYQSAAERLVKHFFPEIEFTCICGNVEDRPVKPDPSIIFSILNESPTPKSQVMMCGDSAVDMETARRACISSVGVTWGFRPATELRRAFADHIVSNPAEIYKLATASPI